MEILILIRRYYILYGLPKGHAKYFPAQNGDPHLTRMPIGLLNCAAVPDLSVVCFAELGYYLSVARFRTL